MWWFLVGQWNRATTVHLTLCLSAHQHIDAVAKPRDLVGLVGNHIRQLISDPLKVR